MRARYGRGQHLPAGRAFRARGPAAAPRPGPGPRAARRAPAAMATASGPRPAPPGRAAGRTAAAAEPRRRRPVGPGREHGAEDAGRQQAEPRCGGLGGGCGRSGERWPRQGGGCSPGDALLSGLPRPCRPWGCGARPVSPGAGGRRRLHLSRWRVWTGTEPTRGPTELGGCPSSGARGDRAALLPSSRPPRALPARPCLAGSRRGGGGGTRAPRLWKGPRTARDRL